MASYEEVDCLIPSLFTFFEDVKLLQVWVDSMRHLVGPGPGAFKVLQALRGSSSQDRRSFEDRVKMRADVRVRRLWIIALRGWQDLSPGPQRNKESLLARVQQQRTDEIALIRFARLADRLGFRSPEIENLKQRDLPGEREGNHPQVRSIGATGTEISGSSDDTNETGDVGGATGQVDRSHHDGSIHVENPESELSDGQIEQLMDAVVTSIVNPATRRCGLPTEAAHERNRPLLYFQNLEFDYATLRPYGLEITSFFAVRSTYFAFFGHPASTELNSDTGQPETIVSESRGQDPAGHSPSLEQREDREAEATVEHTGTGDRALVDCIMREMRQDEEARSANTISADSPQPLITDQDHEPSPQSTAGTEADFWTDENVATEQDAVSQGLEAREQQRSVHITYRTFEGNRFEIISEQQPVHCGARGAAIDVGKEPRALLNGTLVPASG
ncbi:hypothetical protein FCULG_00012979 [Fusarium culmorum]|uniref:Uncharacterized protein n=1 Tax=Fusarium culmorum TaxID=5516 RepID=A0A2T4GGA9_FUSCU|nr:hypothetical protein FCULG_00012979 [Fusarium culmorum]